MANAPTDGNGRKGITCASENDGSTVVPIQANPTTHGIKYDDNTTGSDNGNNGGNAMVDENTTAVWTAVASDASGKIIEVYGDPATGKILIQST